MPYSFLNLDYCSLNMLHISFEAVFVCYVVLLSFLSGIVIAMILLLLMYSHAVDLLFSFLLLFEVQLTPTP